MLIYDSRIIRVKVVLVIFLFLQFFLQASFAHAGKITVAVASNFYPTMKKIVKEFNKRQQTEIILTSGSTGNLYQQIMYGAPFDLFFAADRKRPGLLKKKNPSIGGPWDYAQGRLAIWIPGMGCGAQVHKVLRQVKRIALANPKTAPYGAAAGEYLKIRNLWSSSKSKLAIGQNIAQAFQFVETGNAPLGFIAYAQALQHKLSDSSYCLVAISDLSPIIQQFIITAHGITKSEAHLFKDFILSNRTVKRLISGNGYLLPNS